MISMIQEPSTNARSISSFSFIRTCESANTFKKYAQELAITKYIGPLAVASSARSLFPFRAENSNGRGLEEPPSGWVVLVRCGHGNLFRGPVVVLCGCTRSLFLIISVVPDTLLTALPTGPCGCCVCLQRGCRNECVPAKCDTALKHISSK